MQQKRKIINHLEADELLSLLDGNDQTETETDVKVLIGDYQDVGFFCTHYNLVDGSFPVRTNILHKLYQNFTRKKETASAFSQKIKLFLRTKEGYCYINDSKIKFDKEALFLFGNKPRTMTKNQNIERHIESFFDNNDIKPGKYYVEVVYIFAMYYRWFEKVQTERKAKVSIAMLINHMESKFPNKKWTKESILYFGVSKNVVQHLTEEVKETYNKFLERSYANGRRKIKITTKIRKKAKEEKEKISSRENKV